MDIDGSSFIILSRLNSDGKSDNKAKLEFNNLVDSLSFNQQTVEEGAQRRKWALLFRIKIHTMMGTKEKAIGEDL